MNLSANFELCSLLSYAPIGTRDFSLPSSPLSLSRGGGGGQDKERSWMQKKVEFLDERCSEQDWRDTSFCTDIRGKLTDLKSLKSGITEVRDIYSSTHLWEILSTQVHERVGDCTHYGEYAYWYWGVKNQESEGGEGGGPSYERSACLTLGPRGWVLICGKVLITCRVKALIGKNTVFHVGVSAQLVPVPLPTHARWVQVNLT